MHEPKGSILPISGPRRFIIDLVHFARQVPSTPVSRQVNVSALFEPRAQHPAQPSWALLFMKAYALVGAQNPPLRRALLEFPWPRLYEHPWMNCALAIERQFQGDHGVFVGLFRAPEQQTDRPAPGGADVLQESAAGERGGVPPRLEVQPGAAADPAGVLVEHAERVGVQAARSGSAPSA